MRHIPLRKVSEPPTTRKRRLRRSVDQSISLPRVRDRVKELEAGVSVSDRFVDRIGSRLRVSLPIALT